MNDIKKFEKELLNIEKLISLPNLVRDMVLEVIKEFNFSNLNNSERNQLNNGISAISNIADRSFSKEYSIIYNQVCILAVSVLNAYLEKYFKNTVQSTWKDIDYHERENIKLSLKEISDYKFQITANLGNIILSKDNSINFQDLQSTIRSFSKYLQRDIEIDDKLKQDVIFYQQCRHVLVHKSGIVDDDFLKKVELANKKNYKIGDAIQIDKEDWVCIKESFVNLHATILGKSVKLKNNEKISEEII